MYYYIILYAPFSDRPSSWLLAKYPTLSPSHLIKSPILALYIYIHIPLYHHHFPLNPLCMFGFPPCQLCRLRFESNRDAVRVVSASSHRGSCVPWRIMSTTAAARCSSCGRSAGVARLGLEVIYGSGKSWRMIFESLAICTGRYIHIVLTAIYIYTVYSWLNN